MRIPTPVALSALALTSLVASSSAAHPHTPAPQPKPLPSVHVTTETPNSHKQTLAMLPTLPTPHREIHPAGSNIHELATFGGALSARALPIPLGSGTGPLGIPEIVLAAYRNAELAMRSTTPNCHLSWHLLAGIGKIESGHASNGRTDAAGTSISPILGPALNGTLPDNEVIPATDGGFVRAVGPMQFLPSTWNHYRADGNADGKADPHNVFDAALGAGKYLCSGDLDLANTSQELRAILRYNNSMSYAANVLSWSSAYRTGGAPAQVPVSPRLIPPSSPPATGSDNEHYVDPEVTIDPEAATEPPTPEFTPTPKTGELMIVLPGLPLIPCGILCPPGATSIPGLPDGLVIFIPKPGAPKPPTPESPTPTDPQAKQPDSGSLKQAPPAEAPQVETIPQPEPPTAPTPPPTIPLPFGLTFSVPPVAPQLPTAPQALTATH